MPAPDDEKARLVVDRNYTISMLYREARVQARFG
jgi:hypothetical protein